MSCIAGLLHRGGQSIARSRIEPMLAAMRSRAPDGEELRCEGPVALGQLLLRTGTSNAEATQPISIDGETWIVADARIDGRSELIRKLRARGIAVSSDAPHAALILHARRAFGDNFLDHLIGDFAFAIWDAKAQQLICGRDHFGVRPFHYFEQDGILGFASDIDALLTQPEASRELDDVGVADFLLFGTLQDEDRTIYRDVRCLPPASTLTVTRHGTALRRYWKLPSARETRYPSRSDYVEHYRELFELAVTDRLPDGPVALQLSGGMDSTSIAAVTSERSRASLRPTTAYTLSFKDLQSEQEEWPFAQTVAEHLAIPWTCQDLSSYSAFERPADPALRTSSPCIYPLLAAQYDMQRSLSASGYKVLLSGQGGDATLTQSASHYARLLRSGRWIRLAREMAHHVGHTGTFAGMGLRSVLLRRAPKARQVPPLPDWIASEFAARSGLPVRWARGWRLLYAASDPHLHYQESWLCRQFEQLEALKLPIVARYPFFDLRLIEFSTSVPNFMRADKAILREAMRDKLPESIRQRRKIPLRADFIRATVTNGNHRVGDILEPRFRAAIDAEKYASALDRYTNGEGADSPWTSSLIITPLAYGRWLLQT